MNISYDFFYWGPYLWKTKLELVFCKELLKKGQETLPESQEKICSIINKVQKFVKQEDLIWVGNKLQPYINAYLQSRDQYFKTTLRVTSIELLDLWINYQERYEINPEHTHSGDLSFIIYLQIPDSLIAENKSYKGRSAGPGGIKFRYGEKTDYTISDHYFLPEVGDLYIFPSQLAHEVYPFTSQCTRISVAGNLKII